MPEKPLGRKAYGSIAHAPGSRLGPGDHHAHEGQVRIATERARDRHDKVIVQEKLDGSCVSVAKVDGEIIPLGRAGYRAVTSNFAQHILFHDWAMERWEVFDALLSEGERVVGEWLAQAHGTIYALDGREPFVPFDIIAGQSDDTSVPRITHEGLAARVAVVGLPAIPTMDNSGRPVSIEDAMAWLGEHGYYGADSVEGVVWRVERLSKVEFVIKYVRPDKVDGIYLPESSTAIVTEPIWNWQPAEKGGDDDA